MFRRPHLLLPVFAISLTTAAVLPWDKPPEQWTMSDVFRILQNSPWSPAKFSLESNYTQRTANPQAGVIDDPQVQGRNTVVDGVTLTRYQPSRFCGGLPGPFALRKQRESKPGPP